jgi:hypothetical protein
MYGSISAGTATVENLFGSFITAEEAEGPHQDPADFGCGFSEGEPSGSEGPGGNGPPADPGVTSKKLKPGPRKAKAARAPKKKQGGAVKARAPRKAGAKKGGGKRRVAKKA